jgi:hypothetical protein
MTNETKLRILQRDDGAIFTFAPELESNPRLHPGWLVKKTDGSSEVVLDVAKAVQLNPNSITEREKSLIDENARLREQLANAQGMNFSKPQQAKTAAPAAETLLPGETPLPSDKPEVINLAAIPEEELEPVKFAPEPTIYSDSQLNRMRKEDLFSHAKDLNRAVVIPDGVSRPDLVQICIAEQKAYVERTANPTPIE